MKISILWVMICLLMSACTQGTPQPTEIVAPGTPSLEPTMSTLPNPASAYCEQQGYTLEIRSTADGSRSSMCVFPDGTECDEWAYFRGECQPGAAAEGKGQSDSQGWKIYTNETLGYSFHYPAEAQLIFSAEPKRALIIEGTGLGSESWGIAHPGDIDEYRPPEDANLFQWLTDHYLLGEERLPDEQIAGTTAIHFRHARSPQSYASDFYYFAHRGQLYLITIGHASDMEDWELNNRFLQSFQFEEPISPPINPTAIPAALPIDPGAYRDWTTYTHPVYSFSLRLPDDWIVTEASGGGPGMEGHLLYIQPVDGSHKESIRLTFRKTGEETLLWPTGVGQGEFIPAGTLEIAGEAALRMLLVCPTGEITSIWYHQAENQPDLKRGELEFGFLFSATPTHCEAGSSLSGETQLVGETIIASLSVP